MRGKAAEGGTTCRDISCDLKIHYRIASAMLGQMAALGMVKKVDVQAVAGRIVQFVYVLPDEVFGE